MTRYRFIFLISLIILASLSRLIPHPPNFSSLGAMALFSGAYFYNIRGLPIFIIFISMLLTDSVLGFHSTIPFVYAALALSTILGQKYQAKQSYFRLPLYSLCSSFLFFIISNFGVWVMESFYPKTFAGLGLCYLAAIPFLQNQVFGDLFYTASIFGSFAIAEKFFPVLRKGRQALYEQ